MDVMLASSTIQGKYLYFVYIDSLIDCCSVLNSHLLHFFTEIFVGCSKCVKNDFSRVSHTCKARAKTKYESRKCTYSISNINNNHSFLTLSH